MNAVLYSLLKTLLLGGVLWTILLVAAVVVWAKVVHELTWAEAVQALWRGVPTGPKIIALSNPARPKTARVAPARRRNVIPLKSFAAAVAMLAGANRVTTYTDNQVIPISIPAHNAIP